MPSVALKALAKEKKCHPKLRAAATAAAATFEAAADDAAKKRATIGAAPKDVVAFEPLLPKGAKPARDRLATRVHVREARRKRLRGLVPAAGDATAAARALDRCPGLLSVPAPDDAAVTAFRSEAPWRVRPPGRCPRRPGGGACSASAACCSPSRRSPATR